MATEIRAPYNVFFGEDGYPLEGGYIFIGVSGLNPLSNPLQAYWDSTLTTPAANIRTSAGFPDHNGAIGRLYVPGDYSILVQDKNGRTVYSQLEVTFEYADLLLTELRGTLSRSARAPSTFDCDDIFESGLYSWTNGATTNQPASCAAGDLFMLQVISSPDGAAGFTLQIMTDITEGTTDANAEFRFARYSTDGGATWSTWVVDWVGPFGEAEPGNKAFTAAELNRDLVVLLDNAGAAAIDITAGATRVGTRVTFIQTGAGVATIEWAAGLTVILARYAVQEFIWDGTGWYSISGSHGRIVFGPGALAATTWNVPPGRRKIWVTGAGQGGDGAAGVANTRGGGGGGSGAFTDALELTVVPGTEYTITLDVAGASTMVGGAHNLSFGKGSNGAAAVAGAGGVGAGGVTNGFAGGAGAVGAGDKGGGGGGGVGGVGGAGGGSAGTAGPTIVYAIAALLNVPSYLSAIAGASGLFESPRGTGGVGGYAGAAPALTTYQIGGGGGGGGSALGVAGAAASGGAPFLVIEW